MIKWKLAAWPFSSLAVAATMTCLARRLVHSGGLPGARLPLPIQAWHPVGPMLSLLHHNRPRSRCSAVSMAQAQYERRKTTFRLDELPLQAEVNLNAAFSKKLQTGTADTLQHGFVYCASYEPPDRFFLGAGLKLNWGLWVACRARPVAREQPPPPLLSTDESSCSVWYVDHYGSTVRNAVTADGSDAHPVMTLAIIANNPTSEAPFESTGERLSGVPLAEVHTTAYTGGVTEQVLCKLLENLRDQTTDTGHPDHPGLPVARYLIPDVIASDDDTVHRHVCFRMFKLGKPTDVHARWEAEAERLCEQLPPELLVKSRDLVRDHHLVKEWAQAFKEHNMHILHCAWHHGKAVAKEWVLSHMKGLSGVPRFAVSPQALHVLQFCVPLWAAQHLVMGCLLLSQPDPHAAAQQQCCCCCPYCCPGAGPWAGTRP